jgi:hypothetical protein
MIKRKNHKLDAAKWMKRDAASRSVSYQGAAKDVRNQLVVAAR